MCMCVSVCVCVCVCVCVRLYALFFLPVQLFLRKNQASSRFAWSKQVRLLYNLILNLPNVANQKKKLQTDTIMKHI